MTQDFTIGFLCASTSWGGLEMNVLRVASWLSDRGWPVVLYGQPGSVLYTRAANQGLKTVHLASTFKYGDLVNARRLSQFIKRDNVRVLFINYGKDLFLSVLAKLMSGGFFKLVHQQPLHVGGNKKDAFHTWEYRHLDAWVAPLPMFAGRLTANTHLDSDKIRVIPFGLELDDYTAKRPDRIEARKLLKLPEEVPIAGVIGRLDDKKGQDVLIRACAEVHGQGSPLHILIVGDKTANDSGEYSSGLRNLAEELGLRGFVHFRPFMDDVRHAFAALDIFTLTSHSETYGMVTIEAMACALPVIGTADGGTVEIIDEGVNGLLVPPRDAHSLASALMRLLQDGDLARRLGEKAAEDACARYSHHRQCELLEEMFESLSRT